MQLGIVLFCVAIACAFMIAKICRSVRKGGCNCECEKTCGVGAKLCQGGGECPHQKKLVEITRK